MASKPKSALTDDLSPAELGTVLDETREEVTGKKEAPKNRDKDKDKDKDKKENRIEIRDKVPSSQTLLIPILGTSPLSMSKIPDSAKDHIRLGGMLPPNRRMHRKLPAIHPIQAFCEAIYCRREGHEDIATLTTPFIDPVLKRPIEFKVSMIPGFPAAGFKQAIIDAAAVMREEWGTRIKDVNHAVQILGELVPITFGKVELEEVYPKNIKGQTVHQVHARFFDWMTFLLVRYYPHVVSLDLLISIINAAGEMISVGANRISKKRCGGCFMVSKDTPLEEVGSKEYLNYMKESYEASHGATLLSPEHLELPTLAVMEDKNESKKKGADGKAGGPPKKARKADAKDRRGGRA